MTAYRVQSLALRRFRLFETVSLDLGSGLNFFYGDNGAGKTSLLEGLSVLSRGRSFRAHQLSELAQRPASIGWAADADITEADGLPQRWSARWQDGQLQLAVDAQSQTRVQALQRLPVLCLLPGLHSVVEGAAVERRALLDWAMFHVEPRFMTLWQRYRRALEQRNRALRGGDRRAIQAWHAPLDAAATALQTSRQSLCEQLIPRIADRSHALGLAEAPQLSLYAGWPEDHSLAEVLDQQLESDIRLGYTRAGPHRAELRVTQDGVLARRHLSRGQQKQWVLALGLALLDQVHTVKGRWPILAVDDWQAELSPRSSRQFWEVLRSYPGQVWMTGFEAPVEAGSSAALRLFHVEQRGVRQC